MLMYKRVVYARHKIWSNRTHIKDGRLDLLFYVCYVAVKQKHSIFSIHESKILEQFQVSHKFYTFCFASNYCYIIRYYLIANYFMVSFFKNVSSFCNLLYGVDLMECYVYRGRNVYDVEHSHLQNKISFGEK